MAEDPNRMLAFVEGKVRELAQLTDDAQKGGQVQAMLKASALFHQYSFHNTMLIWFQFPNATRVAGFETWKRLGRFVKRGEHGILIVVPAFVHRTEQRPVVDGLTGIVMGEETVEVTEPRFKSGHVFDVSQTEGRPLPEIPFQFQGERMRFLRDRFVTTLIGKGYRVDFEEMDPLMGGYTEWNARHIALNGNASVDFTFSTLCHEWAHVLLHSNHEGPGQMGLSKEIREVEAESTAWIVCQHYGLQTPSPYYLALWTKDPKSLMQRLQSITKAARETILLIGEGAEGPAATAIEELKASA